MFHPPLSFSMQQTKKERSKYLHTSNALVRLLITLPQYYVIRKYNIFITTLVPDIPLV